ncbi:MAG: RNA polymerase sigma factor [Bacteroidales bacterium]|nr:RNA polymerase sigma factor [Bacteroidales bacterium]
MAQQLRRQALEVCRRMGAPAPEAEDVAQDVMLRLWEMRDDVGRFRSIETLVTIMARNMLISKWRTDKHRSQGLWHTDSELPFAIDSTADPQETIEQQEMLQWLEHRLSELPTTQHTILYMRQVEHRSNSEIAQLLGIEETSVSTLLSRARRALLASISPK